MVAQTARLLRLQAVLLQEVPLGPVGARQPQPAQPPPAVGQQQQGLAPRQAGVPVALVAAQVALLLLQQQVAVGLVAGQV